MLVLPGLDGFDRAKSDAVRETISLRGRRLEGAVLIGANLSKADLTAVRLQGARLGGVNLRGANLGCASRRGDDKQRPEDCAQLQGASLNRAQLQGASLGSAQLQGASLGSAQLQGATLYGAQLRGASLIFAKLQGASLDDAQLQGASLDFAQLQGASLDDAELQGASLNDAQLQGASLDRAQLQGASLKDARLQGTTLHDGCVWRTGWPGNDGMKLARGRFLTVVPTNLPSPKGVTETGCDWSAQRFRDLVSSIEATVPAGKLREAALERIKMRLNPETPLREAVDTAPEWHKLGANSPTDDALDPARAEIVEARRVAGCAAEGAPYVIRGLLRRFAPVFNQESEKILAKAFLDPVTCPAATQLSEDDKASLTAIRGPTPPPR